MIPQGEPMYFFTLVLTIFLSLPAMADSITNISINDYTQIVEQLKEGTEDTLDGFECKQAKVTHELILGLNNERVFTVKTRTSFRCQGQGKKYFGETCIFKKQDLKWIMDYCD